MDAAPARVQSQIPNLNSQIATVCDQVGTVHALVAAVTNNVAVAEPFVAVRYEYSPYGELLDPRLPTASSPLLASLLTSPIGFQSKLRDAETGFWYFGYRFFDSRCAQWLSHDPIREEGGFNLVAFCGGDPVNAVDPLGLASMWNPFGWPGKLVQGAGWFLEKTRIPVVKQAGITVQSAGAMVESPATLLESAVTWNMDTLKKSGEQFARGGLGVIGLEHVIMGEQFAPNRTHGDPAAGRITGSLSLPRPYAEAIMEADREWQTYSQDMQRDDMERGMKRWHIRSNTILAARCGITELPWIWLGGLIHEIEPGGVSAEVHAQGVLGNLIDAPGDIVANTFGILGGLLFPESWLESYTMFTGGLIPGHFNPWVGPGAAPAASVLKGPSIVTTP